MIVIELLYQYEPGSILGVCEKDEVPRIIEEFVKRGAEVKHDKTGAPFIVHDELMWNIYFTEYETVKGDSFGEVTHPAGLYHTFNGYSVWRK